MYYPFEVQVTPLTNVRRERMLPVAGEILVHMGERVEPIQVVARANLPGEFHILPVARLLGVPATRSERCLQVKLGDEVRQGQVIAARGRNRVRSPINGVLTASGAGRVLIEAQPTVLELRAYLHGAVANVLRNVGVVVETTGAVIQGTWGTGGENFGVLRCLVKNPDKPLRAKDIDPSCHGTIIIGGSGLDNAVLERAQELQVRGIVVGGFSPELIPRANPLPFPVIATEGIGDVPMSEPVFRLLTTHEGREASISGHTRVRWGVVRPEVVIPLPAETVPPAPPPGDTPLAVGAWVRVVRAPYAGQVGQVKALPAHTHRIETGARVHGAEIELSGGASVFVPLANLEVLR